MTLSDWLAGGSLLVSLAALAFAVVSFSRTNRFQNFDYRVFLRLDSDPNGPDVSLGKWPGMTGPQLEELVEFLAQKGVPREAAIEEFTGSNRELYQWKYALRNVGKNPAQIEQLTFEFRRENGSGDKMISGAIGRVLQPGEAMSLGFAIGEHALRKARRQLAMPDDEICVVYLRLGYRTPASDDVKWVEKKLVGFPKDGGPPTHGYMSSSDMLT